MAFSVIPQCGNLPALPGCLAPFIRALDRPLASGFSPPEAGLAGADPEPVYATTISRSAAQVTGEFAGWYGLRRPGINLHEGITEKGRRVEKCPLVSRAARTGRWKSETVRSRLKIPPEGVRQSDSDAFERHRVSRGRLTRAARPRVMRGAGQPRANPLSENSLRHASAASGS